VGFIESGVRRQPDGAGYPLPTGLSRLPKGAAKKEQAAQVDARNISDLVGSPGIVGGIDGNVLSQQKSGQRYGHQSAMEDTESKAGDAVEAIDSRYCPIIGATEGQSEQNQNGNLHD
jgi:hypothetical protein